MFLFIGDLLTGCSEKKELEVSDAEQNVLKAAGTYKAY